MIATYGADYHRSISAPSLQHTIPDCGHHFTEDGALENLLQMTVNWIHQQFNEI